uniref:odorant receptor 13a-like isoform X2 n=2 Tax=Vespula vulgaris TaxID=7454 RepID=UPI00223C4E2E|nr:odorant receptor 13a-like isoform X2 [Vespula vulgaris]
MEGTKIVTDFTNAMKAITWSKRLLGYSGIWPLKVRDSLFLPFLFYGCLYSILGFLDLTDFITDFHYVLTNIMENMLMFMTLTKFVICRMKCQSLSRFLIETENDYTVDNYKTKEERLIFMKYNKIASRFITITFPWMTFVLVLHYCRSVIPNILMVMANSSIEYKLPYKIKPLVKPYDAKSYAFGCIHQFFGITLILSGYVGTDCLLACTGFHLTGQLAILKCRVKELLKYTDGSQGRIRQMILRHYRLIRLADILEDSFNVVIFLHLVGSTILLCTSSYQMLFSLAELEKIYIFTFLIYVCLLLCTLFGYCYIGECLIEESTNLCEAIYHCNWYELSTINLQSICICMVRARKPLQLTGAKFCVVSLCTFTDIVKTSMAYLSVIRTFM